MTCKLTVGLRLQQRPCSTSLLGFPATMGLRSWVKTTASRDSEFQSQDAAIPEPDLPFTPGQSSPDVEKSDSLSEKQRDNIQYTDRTPEKTELTPMEAYKWDVSGEQSPFPEVAACVPVTDDHTLEVNSKPVLFLLFMQKSMLMSIYIL